MMMTIMMNSWMTSRRRKIRKKTKKKTSYSLIDDFIHHRYVSVQLDLSRTIDYQIPLNMYVYIQVVGSGDEMMWKNANKSV